MATCRHGGPPRPPSESASCARCASPRPGPVLQSLSFLSLSPGFWKSRHPHPHQPPNELPKAGPARHSLRSRPHRPGPCRNLEGMCLLGPCPVLTEARTRASPCPSLPDTQGFIVRLCHGNYAHGLPVHMASAEKITGPSRSAKTRGPEPPKQASYVTPGPLDTSGGLVWGCPPVTPPPPAPAICLSLLRDLESSARLDRHMLPYMAVSF